MWNIKENLAFFPASSAQELRYQKRRFLVSPVVLRSLYLAFCQTCLQPPNVSYLSPTHLQPLCHRPCSYAATLLYLGTHPTEICRQTLRSSIQENLESQISRIHHVEPRSTVLLAHAVNGLNLPISLSKMAERWENVSVVGHVFAVLAITRCTFRVNVQKTLQLNSSLKWPKEKGWQRCYSCSAMVELKEGCNHMTCRCTV